MARHRPWEFPLEVSAVKSGRRHVIVGVGGTDYYGRLTVTSMPDGVEEERLKIAIEEAGEIHLDAEGPYCDIDEGRVRFERAPIGVELLEINGWNTLTVTGHLDEGIEMDLENRRVNFTLAGDGQTPLSAMQEALAQVFPIGSPMTFRQNIYGIIGEVMHPDPLVDTMSLAALASQGVTAKHLREIALPNARLTGASTTDITIGEVVSTAHHWDKAKNPEESEVPQVHCEDGIMTCSVTIGGVVYDRGDIILLGVTVPDTAMAALTGRRLSRMYDAGFPHPDPVITSVRCTGGATIVRCEMQTMRLSECHGETDK